MSRRQLFALFSVGLIVLSAGCAGLSGGGASGTSTPDNTSTTPVDTVSDSELPPGVTADSVNGSELIQTSFASLESTKNYQYELSVDGQLLKPGLKYNVPLVTQLTLTRDGEKLRSIMRHSMAEEQFLGSKFWRNQDSVATARYTRNNTQYSEYTTKADMSSTAEFSNTVISTHFKQMVYMMDFKPVEMTTYNGDRVVNLSASSPASTETDITSGSATIYATPAGQVKHFKFTGEYDSQSFTISYDLTTENTSLTEPDWTKNTPDISTSLTENNTVLVINHNGGATIPTTANYTVQSADYGAKPINIGELTSGDTVYVYLEKTDGGVTAHTSETLPENTANLLNIKDSPAGVVIDSDVTRLFLNPLSSSD
ncbi:hypothetical protein [Salinibaculum rarum]|uniref:hypothetical protein n=1 Tax=Salinibaculum rarum TaxID=3058903 RepID=UPI00265EDE14|nr:hypothetical protein [Salinibaculum sp. KK48]